MIEKYFGLPLHGETKARKRRAERLLAGKPDYVGAALGR